MTDTYVGRLRSALRCFESRGTLHLDARTMSGIGHKALAVTAPAIRAVPLTLTQALLDNFCLRLNMLTWNGTTPCDVPCLVALWKPETGFYHLNPDEPGGTSTSPYFVPAREHERITAALAVLPEPSLAVDAGPELWAAWRLTHPLSVADARPALIELAARLGSERPPAALEEFTLPIAGPARNWNVVVPQQITVLKADPKRTYAVDDLVRPARLPSDPSPSEQEPHHERDPHYPGGTKGARAARRT